MTKADIIAKVAENNNLTKKKAAEILDSVLNIVATGLKEDGTVQVIGFGTLKAKTTEAYEAINPRNTSEKIFVPARKRISFTAGKALKKSVNE